MEAGEHAQTQDTGTDATRRPSLAERLMNPPDQTSANSPTAAEQPPPAADSPAPSQARAGLSQRQAFTALRPRPDLNGSDALRDARRFVRVRYFSFLASMLILLITFVVAVVVLATSLLGDGDWKVQAGAGAVAAVALLLLIFLQYRPASGFAAAAAELAQLEALGSHLERSYALWDAFLEDREAQQQVSANEIALAVSSMTSATRELVAAQADLASVRRRPRGNEPPQRPTLPTAVNPDPRRYQ